MSLITKACFLMLLCAVVINAIGVGVNDIGPEVSDSSVQDVHNDIKDKKPRFMDFDSFITGAMSGMDVKVENYVNQGSSVIKKVTQSHHGTLGGQTIVKTEVTEYSGNNPVGFRFKRDLFDDVIGSMENKAELVKHKIAGAMADGVNLAHSETSTQANPVPTNTRGLFSDLYVQNMRVTPSPVHHESSVGSTYSDEDVGEKFTLAVVKTAVALADTGIQTAHEILKTVGSEVVEAFKAK